jgi:hypothetical protein
MCATSRGIGPRLGVSHGGNCPAPASSRTILRQITAGVFLKSLLEAKVVNVLLNKCKTSIEHGAFLSNCQERFGSLSTCLAVCQRIFASGGCDFCTDGRPAPRSRRLLQLPWPCTLVSPCPGLRATKFFTHATTKPRLGSGRGCSASG